MHDGFPILQLGGDRVLEGSSFGCGVKCSALGFEDLRFGDISVAEELRYKGLFCWNHFS